MGTSIKKFFQLASNLTLIVSLLQNIKLYSRFDLKWCDYVSTKMVCDINHIVLVIDHWIKQTVNQTSNKNKKIIEHTKPN